MALNFNETKVTAVNFNGTSVTQWNQNGVKVWPDNMWIDNGNVISPFARRNIAVGGGNAIFYRGGEPVVTSNGLNCSYTEHYNAVLIAGLSNPIDVTTANTLRVKCGSRTAYDGAIRYIILTNDITTTLNVWNSGSYTYTIDGYNNGADTVILRTNKIVVGTGGTYNSFGTYSEATIDIDVSGLTGTVYFNMVAGTVNISSYTDFTIKNIELI